MNATFSLVVFLSSTIYTKLDELTLLNPSYANAYYNRAKARDEQGDKQGALADFNEAIRLEPNDADSYYNRGIVRNEQRDIQGAIADYNEAIRLNPKYTYA